MADEAPAGPSGGGDTIDPNWLLVFGTWLIAAVAMLGSLFFSEVMHFAPCSLCWYQRIFMYPLVLVLLLGMLPFDPKVVRYALPLAIGGWLVGLYHTLLYEGVIPESAAPCSMGVSCSEEYIELFGFLSIPMLSLLASTAMVGALLVLRKRLSS
jgi:disulfide bond formation protein DsbB